MRGRWTACVCCGHEGGRILKVPDFRRGYIDKAKAAGITLKLPDGPAIHEGCLTRMRVLTEIMRKARLARDGKEIESAGHRDNRL